MTWSRATAIAGSVVVTLASCRIWIVRGHREPPRDCGDDRTPALVFKHTGSGARSVPLLPCGRLASRIKRKGGEPIIERLHRIGPLAGQGMQLRYAHTELMTDAVEPLNYRLTALALD